MNTLKRLIAAIAFLALTFVSTAQDFNNIEFIENKGQWDPRVRYKGEVSGGAVFITTTGFTILQHNSDDYAALQSYMHEHGTKSPYSIQRPDGSLVIRSHAYNVEFVGASPKMKVLADKPAAGENNYFIGDDASKWGEGCKIYQAVTLQDVYPNVDVRYYTYNGFLKYDIVARPGADIKKIALRYNGAQKLQVKNKELVVSTSVGDLRESYPYTYQSSMKEKREINCKYVVKDNVVRFDVKDYDPNATLIIDPAFRWCSFAGSTANNWGFTATYDDQGNFYGGGIVFSGNTWPVNTGAFQTTFQGGNGPLPVDIGIIKLSADGTTRMYATYIGGSGNEQPHSLIVDPQGNLVIAGRTSSPLTGAGAYPVTGGAAGIIGTCGGYDIIVTKLNANGSGLIGSKRIGGTGNDGVNIKEGRTGRSSLEQNYGDDGRSEVILDGGGNIYVASCTQSNSATAADRFPVTAGAFQQNFAGGNQDAVVLKFSPDVSTRIFSSYLGGSGNDAAYVLSLAPNGDIYVGGGTERGTSGTSTDTDFFGSHAGTVGPAHNGAIDGFVAQISNNGSTLIRSAYIGAPEAGAVDQVYGIQFDRNGFVYIMGTTTGTMAPINATYVNAGSKQFIGKLQPDLSAYVYRTVFGNGSATPNISPTAFLVDRCENVYVSGWGGLINEQNPSSYPSGGTLNMPLTSDALPYPIGGPDGKDFYFFVLKKDAASQLFGSYFGQNGGFADHVDGGTSRFDRNGVIYQGMCANCGGGSVPPTSPGVWATTKPASAFCNLGMVKINFDLAGVGADVSSQIGGVPNDTAGCVPLDVTFTDQVRNAKEYIWNFGDGTGDFGPYRADTGYTRTHTFTAVGTYRVMLIAIDPTSCNVRDTSYINIKVGDLKANLAAIFAKLDPCEQFNYRFDNLSTTNPSRPFTNTSFVWKFGDNSAPVVAGLNSVTHTYPAPGTYQAVLIMQDTAYCNYPDSLPLEVRVAANVQAIIDPVADGCAPYLAEFHNGSIGGATFDWNFGDPGSPDNTSTATSPTHEYANPGTYTVTLTANDPNTCNKTSTTSIIVNVYDKPTSNFSYTPVTPIVNTPNIFTNLASANSVKFKWLFGDGDSLVTTSRADVSHQYNATGTFNACLIAFNPAGCSDTFCLDVNVIVEPALDVPNAFTPNSGDINSVVMPRGFGIAKMRFIIWNRWGQKVFETATRNQGWDGKVKGVVQPMDVYAYTLDVEFFDGTKATKKGDITLIR
jgi:gliding motility-associated-like protein